MNTTIRRMLLRAVLRDRSQRHLRDIAQHIVWMRSAGLTRAHMKFHHVVILGDPLMREIVRQGNALARHLGLARFGTFGRYLTHYLIVRPYASDPADRILERVGPCPEIHDRAAEGVEAAEAHANGETHA